MPTPSKFTADRKEEILRCARLGGSNSTCAAAGGIGEATLRDWLERGANSEEGSAYRDFYEAFQAAKAVPNVRALEIVQKAMADKPDLAWKFLERREGGFAPPAPQAPAASAGPVLIQLAFVNGQPSGEGTVIDVPEIPTRPRRISEASTADRGKAS